ncbi:unnamed protein product [Cylicocyclus nassatus]|uniref:Resistance to inhibitors of cholinesterase protein 3 N-terminal domain-containing protein n=1 Tax=Cylicocyclus nassatus TaxID=53992 RepID=A0AA36M9Q1_CYLNA|nr:unnamed protein product [Cylicocyclus nassatus]
MTSKKLCIIPKMPDRGRERERKRRRRYSDEEDDDNGFTGWKLGLVVGVIVVCFAMLYPTVIHPMLMGFMGRKEPPRPTPSRPPVHPGMGGPAMHARPGGGRGDIHPAMRMAQQQAETQSGGRGMFTWMLPLYTVGVVIFLLYTLFKTKSKKKRRSRYDDSEYSSDDGDEYNDRLKKKIGKRKLRGLQERLQQTEEAMNKILEQLEAVQAAGALVEGEQDTATKTGENKENSEPKPNLNAKNDQYINDLEKALRDFKVLSDAYEEEKGLRKKRRSGSEDDTSTEELISGSDEEESEEEEEEQTRKKKKHTKKHSDDSEEESNGKGKKKAQKKKRKEESDEHEDEQQELTEETNLLEEESEPSRATQPSSKNVRRRARKV